MVKAKRFLSWALAFVMVLILLIAETPQTAFADAEVTYTYVQNGNSGASITFSSAVTAVSVSDESLAEAGFSGNTVTVTAKTGAAGVATVTAAVDGTSQRIAVPVGYTTFLLEGKTVTVYPGTDTNFEIAGYDSAETEYTPSRTDNADGSVTYAADSSCSLFVEIKKSGGVYAFSGTGEDISVAVKKNATANASLLLAGLSLSNSMTAPVIVRKKDDEAAIAADARVCITALEGHENTLADAAFNNDDDYPDNVLAESAVIKGKAYADIILDGHGTLNLSCATKNAVKVAEYGSLTVRNLTLNITSAKHGLSSDNEMTLWSGNINITANAGDGIRSDPDTVDASNGASGRITFYDADVTIHSYNDGVQAAQDLTIYGGTFAITTFNGYQNNQALEAADLSAKGLKASKSTEDETTDTGEATNELHIYNGSFSLNCADDAIHSDAFAVIEGGEFDIYTGDDAAHADTSLTLGREGGMDCDVLMKINSCREGLEAGNVYVYSGSYDILSSDDGINAAGGNGGSTEGFHPGGGPGGWGNQGFNPGGQTGSGDYSINIYGGRIKIAASGDGIDSNGALNMTGGTAIVFGGQGAENPLDYDGSFYINGATVFAAGSNSMGVRNPVSGSQSYRTAAASLTQGRTVTVTVNGETVVSQEVASRASYEFYSQPAAFSSMTVSQGTDAAKNIPAAFAEHTDTCGHQTNGASGIADPSAADSDDRVDREGTAAPTATPTPAPTETPAPTATPTPTEAPAPTATPILTPTSTPTPTNTPTPTPTPVLAGRITLNKSAAKVLVGLTLQLKANVTPSDASDGEVSWKSGDTKIATVSSSGLVTAKSAGTVTIRAMTESGLKAYCKVTVAFRYVYECEKDGVYRYTTNTAIVRQLRDEGWTYRKAFRAPGFSSAKVYWIYNKTTKRYRYTTSLSYAKKMKEAGNKAGFAFYQSDDLSKPVYELQKGSKRITYYYTTSASVRAKMIAQGWTDGGIAWYAQPKSEG